MLTILRFLSCMMMIVTGLATPSHADPDNQTILTIIRQSGAELDLSRSELRKLGLHEFVTRLVDGRESTSTVKGPLFRDVISLADPEAKMLRVIAHNDYVADVPVSDLVDYPVILALEIDGKSIGIREKGPTWVIYPVVDYPELQTENYTARSVWSVDRIEIVD